MRLGARRRDSRSRPLRVADARRYSGPRQGHRRAASTRQPKRRSTRSGRTAPGRGHPSGGHSAHPPHTRRPRPGPLPGGSRGRLIQRQDEVSLANGDARCAVASGSRTPTEDASGTGQRSRPPAKRPAPTNARFGKTLVADRCNGSHRVDAAHATKHLRMLWSRHRVISAPASAITESSNIFEPCEGLSLSCASRNRYRCLCCYTGQKVASLQCAQALLGRLLRIAATICPNKKALAERSFTQQTVRMQQLTVPRALLGVLVKPTIGSLYVAPKTNDKFPRPNFPRASNPFVSRAHGPRVHATESTNMLFSRHRAHGDHSWNSLRMANFDSIQVLAMSIIKSLFSSHPRPPST